MKVYKALTSNSKSIARSALRQKTNLSPTLRYHRQAEIDDENYYMQFKPGHKKPQTPCNPPLSLS